MGSETGGRAAGDALRRGREADRVFAAAIRGRAIGVYPVYRFSMFGLTRDALRRGREADPVVVVAICDWAGRRVLLRGGICRFGDCFPGWLSIRTTAHYSVLGECCRTHVVIACLGRRGMLSGEAVRQTQ